MRIAALAFGTHGDVRPVVALGRALKARGAEVCLITGTDQVAFIERNGLEAAPADVDFRKLFSSSAGVSVVESGTGARTQTRTIKRMHGPVTPALMRAAYQGAIGADVIMSGFISDIYALSVAEKLGIPHISAELSPAPIATGNGAAMLMAPFPGRKSVINRIYHKAMLEPFNWRVAGEALNVLRTTEYGLPPQRRADYQRRLEQGLVLQAFSGLMVPDPSDWPDTVHTTGYWFLDEQDTGWTPPPALRDFLAAGEPPVFLGFGSMTASDVQRNTRLLIAAVEASGQRAVLQAGWGGFGAGELPDRIHVIEEAPHQRLFPHMSCVVHHGGAGHTAAGLRAGLPTMIIPHFADQPFWGARVAALGVGPKPMRWTELTVETLAAALRRIATDQAMRERAQDLGRRMNAEDGVGTAVGLIEQYLDKAGTRSAAVRPGS
jgi:sterol 3beta-glucosyltransferase